MKPSPTDQDDRTVVVVMSASLLVLGAMTFWAISGLPWSDRSDGAATPDARSQIEVAPPITGPDPTERVDPGDTNASSAPAGPTTNFPVAETTTAGTTVVPTPPSPDETVASQGPIPSSSARPQDDGSVLPVERIWIVPAFRDVIMSIDGEAVASDATGTIDIPNGSGDRVIEFVGSGAEPPLRQFEIVGWGDTSTATVRRVAELPGPVVELGLQTRVRVVVGLDPGSVSADAIVFSATDLGEITVPVGEPTWVPETTARLGEGRFEVVAVSYVAVASIADGERTPARPLRFEPTPEARWVVGR